MAAYDGVGERLREAMLAKGYARADGKPDVQRFCWDHRFDRTLVYDWLDDRSTPFKDLIRLCTALDCSVEWLLSGRERDPKKAAPARSRPHKSRGLLVALSLGAAAALWPSPSAAGQEHPLLVRFYGLVPAAMVDYVRSRRFWKSFRYFCRGIAYAT